MKSEILNQFQSSMYELNSLSTFKRGKDKTKRKSRGSGLAVAGGVTGASALGLAGASKGLSNLQSSTAVSGRNIAKAAANVEKKAFRNAVNGVASPEQSKKLAGSLKKMASDRFNVSKMAGKSKLIAKGGAKVAGLAAGGLLAAGAVKALRNNKKKK